MSAFHCLHCGRTTSARRRECPFCGGFKTIVRADVESGRSSPQRPSGPVRASEIRRVALRHVKTGIAPWDDVLGGGAGVGGAILLAGAPGVGKSTHALYAASQIARALRRDALFLSAEMPAEMVVEAGARVGADLDRVLVFETDDADDAAREVLRARPACVVWDSVQTFVVDGAAGSDSVTCEVIRRAMDAGARVRAVSWLISQLNKDGEPEGRYRAQHAADTVMMLAPERVTVSKNRFAPAPREAGAWSRFTR